MRREPRSERTDSVIVIIWRILFWESVKEDEEVSSRKRGAAEGRKLRGGMGERGERGLFAESKRNITGNKKGWSGRRGECSRFTLLRCDNQSVTTKIYLTASQVFLLFLLCWPNTILPIFQSLHHFILDQVSSCRPAQC